MQDCGPGLDQLWLSHHSFRQLLVFRRQRMKERARVHRSIQKWNGRKPIRKWKGWPPPVHGECVYTKPGEKEEWVNLQALGLMEYKGCHLGERESNTRIHMGHLAFGRVISRPRSLWPDSSSAEQLPLRMGTSKAGMIKVGSALSLRAKKRVTRILAFCAFRMRYWRWA